MLIPVATRAAVTSRPRGSVSSCRPKDPPASLLVAGDQPLQHELPKPLRSDVVLCCSDVVLCCSDVVLCCSDVVFCYDDVVFCCDDVVRCFDDVVRSRHDVMLRFADVVLCFHDVVRPEMDVHFFAALRAAVASALVP